MRLISSFIAYYHFINTVNGSVLCQVDWATTKAHPLIHFNRRFFTKCQQYCCKSETGKYFCCSEERLQHVPPDVRDADVFVGVIIISIMTIVIVLGLKCCGCFCSNDKYSRKKRHRAEADSSTDVTDSHCNSIAVIATNPPPTCFLQPPPYCTEPPEYTSRRPSTSTTNYNSDGEPSNRIRRHSAPSAERQLVVRCNPPEYNNGQLRTRSLSSENIHSLLSVSIPEISASPPPAYRDICSSSLRTDQEQNQISNFSCDIID